MPSAFINTIATAVPDFDVHEKFIQYCPRLLDDKRSARLFQRMVERAQIQHRYSFLEPHRDEDKMDTQGFYRPEAFPDTAARMQFYEQYAFPLAKRALDQLDLGQITHLVVTTCTGFFAPGLDQKIIDHYGLSTHVECTTIGFMGCFAAFNALKLARHIVRSEENAKVLVVNLELCTLHLKPTGTLEEMLSFLIFADGCAASIVSSTPDGLELQDFKSVVVPETQGLITWRIGDLGFDMHLSGQVPAAIAANLPVQLHHLLNGYTRNDITHWAIHPGGRSVLDAVKTGGQLEEQQLSRSRDILRRFGNMSSATIMFVLQDILDNAGQPGLGFAMGFGPGLKVESMRFAVAGKS